LSEREASARVRGRERSAVFRTSPAVFAAGRARAADKTDLSAPYDVAPNLDECAIAPLFPVCFVVSGAQ
jgi:hypothetical protein